MKTKVIIGLLLILLLATLSAYTVVTVRGQGLELIENGGFENWTTEDTPESWETYWPPLNVIQTTDAHSGIYAIKMGDPHESSFIHQKVPVAPGFTYVFSAWQKYPEVTARSDFTQICLLWLKADGTIIPWDVLRVGTSADDPTLYETSLWILCFWQWLRSDTYALFRFHLKAPAEAAQLDVQIAQPGWGVLYVDDISLASLNVAPTVNSISATILPTQVNSPISASATFTDPDVLDTHTAVWSWGDGTSSSGTVSEVSGSGSVTGSHSFANAGIYTVALTVTDNHGGEGSAICAEYVVIYDPNGGFVTGGGWIDSPAGAYTTNPTLAGKATFGFVSKYQKGATVPTGNTEFQFHAAGMNFKSTSYEWLVIAGSTAQYKGEGTINGAGNYKFMLWADDGGKNCFDTFRLRITDTDGNAVYDNGGKQAITGGSIVIQTK